MLNIQLTQEEYDLLWSAVADASSSLWVSAQQARRAQEGNTVNPEHAAEVLLWAAEQEAKSKTYQDLCLTLAERVLT